MSSRGLTQLPVLPEPDYTENYTDIFYLFLGDSTKDYLEEEPLKRDLKKVGYVMTDDIMNLMMAAAIPADDPRNGPFDSDHEWKLYLDMFINILNKAWDYTTPDYLEDDVDRLCSVAYMRWRDIAHHPYRIQRLLRERRRPT